MLQPPWPKVLVLLMESWQSEQVSVPVSRSGLTCSSVAWEFHVPALCLRALRGHKGSRWAWVPVAPNWSSVKGNH